jgi:hypothetical protein
MQLASLLRHGLLKHYVLDPLVCLHLSGCSHTTAPPPRYIQHSSLMQETHLLRELHLLRQRHSSPYITSSKNALTFLPHICKSFCIIYRVTQRHLVPSEYCAFRHNTQTPSRIPTFYRVKLNMKRLSDAFLNFDT